MIVATPKTALLVSVLSSLAWSAIKSSDTNHSNIACFRAKTLEISLKGIQKLVIDGEVLDAQTITVSVNPQALQVIAPIPLKS